MKVKQIYEEARTSLYNDVEYSNRLDYCQAYVIGNSNYEILRSYGIDVAVMDKLHRIILINGWYSKTTDKHISKWVKLHINTPIIYLYRRSNNIAVLYNEWTRKPMLKYGKRKRTLPVMDFETQSHRDFEDVITFTINNCF